MKVIEVVAAIKERLSETHDQVYFRRPAPTAVYPYLVFDLPNSVDDGVMENFVLEVDAWDSPEDGDETMLLAIGGAADAALQRAVMLPPGMALIVYKDNTMAIPDPEEGIYRWKYRYQIRTYGG